MTGSSEPLVSVIVPVFNRAAQVEHSIRSVLEQSYTNLEVVAVDDGSSDGSAAAVEAIADDRVRLVRHPVNRGGGAARNTGIEHAAGELIAFQDSDDVWLPGKLARQVAVLAAAPPAVGMVACPYRRPTPEGTEIVPPSGAWPNAAALRRALLTANFIGTPTVVIRRACLESSGGFDPRLPRLQDWELWLRISASCEIAFIDEPLVVAEASPNSISADAAALVAAYRIILERHRETFAASGSDVLAFQLRQLGHLECLAGDVRAGRNNLRASLGAAFGLRGAAGYGLSFGGARVYAWAVGAMRAVRAAALPRKPRGSHRRLRSVVRGPGP